MNICIVTAHTTEIVEMANKTLLNKTAYCVKHNYNITAHHGRLGIGDPSWDKLLLVKALLPYYQWVVWIDSDCIFNNFNKRLESYFAKDGVFVRDFASTDENRNTQLVNACVFALRNCSNSFDFLQTISKQQPSEIKDISKRSYEGWPWEQGPISVELQRNDYFSVLSDMDINSHPSIATADTFIIHYMGWRATAETEQAALSDITRRNLVLLT
jgi:hypothetical protein